MSLAPPKGPHECHFCNDTGTYFYYSDPVALIPSTRWVYCRWCERGLWKFREIVLEDGTIALVSRPPEGQGAAKPMTAQGERDAREA